ncbi:MAG: lysine--tRNA ligase [Pseudanabaenaceae cyanobacterium SKYGB_i_bin29]|nr:lysine--tRNA ligase [Pseudanabaenaceae cyanobacterium SKYG29]MDW8421311.1 lysine--tRNA ligase [Pseudanabaenaceae cyanobacterium SKYGB_i_bin29]
MSRNEAEVRVAKAEELRQAHINPYPSQSVERTHTTQAVVEQFGDRLANGMVDPEGKVLKLCGRITAKRDSGNLVFIDLRDEFGRLQLKIEKKGVREDSVLSFAQIKKLLDEGDFISAEGVACRTNKGELSLQVERMSILAKAQIPFPDVYYGVNDVEVCRRHREMHLASNPAVLQRFKLRSQIIFQIRSFLTERGFAEIETPILQSIYGGAAARPFVTHHNALDVDLYLRIAPELYLKRAICGGFERVFELGRVFRNEGIDSTHNPEFTSLEVYQAYADYIDILTLVEDVIIHCAKTVYPDISQIPYQGKTIDLTPAYEYNGKKHWRILTMTEAVQKYVGIDFTNIDLAAALAAVKAKNIHLSQLEEQSLGYLLYAVFDKCVAPQLEQPTFVIDFPVEVSPLAKQHRSKEGFVERFELFIQGMEYANGFSELNDPQEQRRRFEQQLAQKYAGDEEAHPMDEDFIQALALGMPTCAGMGIGIDRLIMLLTDTASIRDVVMFPTMRPRQ